MTCQPIEIICEDCGRLRTSVLIDTEIFGKQTAEMYRREISAFILAMHREAQHPKETKRET